MADDRDRAEIAEDNGCTIQQEDSKEISHDADQESKNTVTGNSAEKDGQKKTGKEKGYANLIPMNKMTEAEQREIARKGGKASAESRKRRKTAKEIAQTILSTQLNAAQIEEILDGAKDLIGEDKSAYAVMIAKMVQEANRGNVQAFTAVRDTAGDKPTDKQEVTAAVTAGDVALLGKVAARLGIPRPGEDTE